MLLREEHLLRNYININKRDLLILINIYSTEPYYSILTKIDVQKRVAPIRVSEISGEPNSSTSNMPLSINCLKVITRLKRKQYGKRFFKKRQFKIKAIIYGNKQNIPNKREDVRLIDWNPRIIETKAGPIRKMVYERHLKSVIGNINFRIHHHCSIKCLFFNMMIYEIVIR